MSLRQTILRRLPADRRLQLRDMRDHARRFLSAVVSGVETPDAITFADEVHRDIATSQVAYATAKDGQRMPVLLSLMRKVSFDVRYAAVLQEPYVRRLFTDEAFYLYLSGAASFGAGDIDKATECFDQLLQVASEPFAWVCRSRCDSHGRQRDDLAIPILEEARKRYPRDYSVAVSLATALFRNGQTAKANQILSEIDGDLRRIIQASDPNNDGLAREIDTAINAKATVRPKGPRQDTYTEESVENHWKRLWFHMKTGNRNQHGWPNLYATYQEKIAGVLESDPNVTNVCNFGVFCALPDHALAVRYPDRHFYGVDRELRTKQLNDAAFQAPNLEFMAANIMDVLGDIASRGPTMLFHARTATLCYPEFLSQFYAECHRKGIEYIGLWENNSISYSHLRFYDSGQMPAVSIAYKEHMFLHDYPVLLRQAGYEPVTIERRTGNRDLLEKDFQLADGHTFVLAKRIR